jgi:hypothetical protein
MTNVSIDDRAHSWSWKGGGVTEVVCICGRQMRLLHVWNRASLWQCDDCKTSVRLKRQSEGERGEGDSSSN